MTYNEATEFLFTQIPMFQREGAGAYKPGLDTARHLNNIFGNPQNEFPTIHIAGTNGKGSTSHTLAAILQSAGYRVGLFTSPHLVDFRERIRVNGNMISHEAVVDFLERYLRCNSSIKPSFFELTTTMAFEHFRNENVDIAIIEVGLGGRLDSTNVITPILSIITNISLDHTAQLGTTLEEIAGEKAGIIKPGIPVIIGEASGVVKDVFITKAKQAESTITFADEHLPFSSVTHSSTHNIYHNTVYGDIPSELIGDYQIKNTATVLTALHKLNQIGLKFRKEDVLNGFVNVNKLTGLMGRWSTLSTSPHVICDTGHNIGGWQYISKQLASLSGQKHIVLGFVSDKDISEILDLLDSKYHYYFTNANIPRALPANVLAEMAQAKGLIGNSYSSVKEAYNVALTNAQPEDIIFIGGSTFVVADLLSENLL